MGVICWPYLTDNKTSSGGGGTNEGHTPSKPSIIDIFIPGNGDRTPPKPESSCCLPWWTFVLGTGVLAFWFRDDIHGLLWPAPGPGPDPAPGPLNWPLHNPTTHRPIYQDRERDPDFKPEPIVVVNDQVPVPDMVEQDNCGCVVDAPCPGATYIPGSPGGQTCDKICPTWDESTCKWYKAPVKKEDKWPEYGCVEAGGEYLGEGNWRCPERERPILGAGVFDIANSAIDDTWRNLMLWKHEAERCAEIDHRWCFGDKTEEVKQVWMEEQKASGRGKLIHHLKRRNQVTNAEYNFYKNKCPMSSISKHQAGTCGWSTALSDRDTMYTGDYSPDR